MIMRRGQPLLLPVSPLFIWSSLLVALMVNMLTSIAGAGRSPWMPDLLAVTLVFWSVHQPLRIGIGVAFAFGLVMDVHQSALLGQHALSYTVLSYFAITIHGGLYPGWSILLAPVLESALWPVVSVLLLLPQKQSPDPDKNRPL